MIRREPFRVPRVDAGGITFGAVQRGEFVPYRSVASLALGVDFGFEAKRKAKRSEAKSEAKRSEAKSERSEKREAKRARF